MAVNACLAQEAKKSCCVFWLLCLYFSSPVFLFFYNYPFSVPYAMLLVLCPLAGRAVASSGRVHGRNLCHRCHPCGSKPRWCIHTPLWQGHDCHLPDGVLPTFCANTFIFSQVHQVFSPAALSRAWANTCSRRPVGDILAGTWEGGTGKLFQNLENGVVQFRGRQQRHLVPLC